MVCNFGFVFNTYSNPARTLPNPKIVLLLARYHLPSICLFLQLQSSQSQAKIRLGIFSSRAPSWYDFRQ